MVFATGNLFERALGDDGVWLGVGDGWGGGWALEVVVFFDEQPVGFALGGGFAAHTDQRPLAVHLGAVKNELEAPVAETGVDIGVALLWFPGSLVPKHDSASAVLASGDDALEAAVFHGVVFHLDGEALVGDDVAWTLGAGPALQDAVPTKAEVVVQV